MHSLHRGIPFGTADGSTLLVKSQADIRLLWGNHAAYSGHGLGSGQGQECRHLYLQEQKEEASGEPERMVGMVRFRSHT